MIDKDLAFTHGAKNGGSWLRIAVLIVAVVVLVTLVAYWVMLRPVSNDEKTVQVEIPATGLSGVAQALDDANVIRSPFAFKVYVVLSGAQKQLKAGTYSLHVNAPASAIVAQLRTGKRGDEITIRIIEGWNTRQVAAYLQEQGLDITTEQLDAAVREQARAGITGTGFANFGGLTEADIATLPAEGFLYPDTYKVFPGATAKDIVQKMSQNMSSKISDPAFQRALEKSNMTLYEVLTLASIVEKEVAHPEDRALVAGIFLNRLNTNIALQSDATVNYVTGKKDTTPSGKDLETQSVYNTYQNRGLPPTPISNPSIRSLEAVVNPTKSDYFYFLTTPAPENKTIFSKTYDEHLENRAKYY